MPFCRSALFLLFIFFILFNANLCARPFVKFRIKPNILQHGASTELIVADGYKFQQAKKKSFRTKDYQLDLYARNFKQGELVYLECLPILDEQLLLQKRDLMSEKRLKIFFNKREVPVTSTHWGYKAFIALAPKLRVGTYTLYVAIKKKSANANEAETKATRKYRSYRHRFRIQRKRYPVSRSRIYLRGSRAAAGKKLSDEKRQEIREFAREKKQAFAKYTERLFIRRRLSHPRDRHFITSQFWAKRYIARYRRRKGRTIQIKPRITIHGGLDLRARPGEPVYAIADGKVILSRKMHYEGNFVLLDHGQGIFSGYMHLNDRYVYRGNRVEAGQQIGEAGATGYVSGAHLHVLLHVRNVAIDPLSLLVLPVRN